MGRAVFDRQTVNRAKFDPAAFYVVGKQMLQHARRFICDDGTDAVAAADANDDLVKTFVICKFLFGFNPFVALELHLHKRCEFFSGFFDFLFQLHFPPVGLLNEQLIMIIL